MIRAVLHGQRIYCSGTRSFSSNVPTPPIISINNGTFYRRYPSSTDKDASFNPPIFPGLHFELRTQTTEPQYWAIVGSSNAGKTTLLNILRGQCLCIPPTARSYPFLSDQIDTRYRNPARAIQYVGFDGETNGGAKSRTRGAYLSARYESRREDGDFSVLDYLVGNIGANPSEGLDINGQALTKVVKDLNLQDLLLMSMGNLSNGQARRATIARALMGKPMILLLDEPFMGLDPPTVADLSGLLFRMAEANAPRLVLALRPQDSLPTWITHVIRLRQPLSISSQGSRGVDLPTRPLDRIRENNVEIDKKTHTHQRGFPILGTGTLKSASPLFKRTREGLVFGTGKSSRGVIEGPPSLSPAIRPPSSGKQALVSMQGVQLSYGEKTVLGDWEQIRQGRGLWWNIYQGTRWGIFGPNGSGKTTLLSLICSDHPQAYSQPIKIFGQSRLPQPGCPGISIFDIQTRIGQSSPEIHAFFPKMLSLRETLESAWADTFLGTPPLTFAIDEDVDACLRWFEAELNPIFDARTTVTKESMNAEDAYSQPRSTNWADKISFGEASFSAQRVALFLRAIIKKPELVILDEAFSGMDDYVRDKCILFLTWGETRSFKISKVDETWKRYVLPTPKRMIDDHKPITGFPKDSALICVSHVKEEVPGLVKQWMCLPEPGKGQPPRIGSLGRPLDAEEGLWNKIWGL